MRDDSGVFIDMTKIDAIIFDMDGVVTDTASVHATVWKKMFDEYLEERSRRLGEPFHPFSMETDYIRYVDGKPRYDGVESFLQSRGIDIPHGTPEDPPGEETACGLGNRKNVFFLNHLDEYPAERYESTVEFIHAAKARGKRMAIISASRNAEKVLRAAGVEDLFDVKVDGQDAAALGLKGKPDPAVFLEAARHLGVHPSRAMVVEDALAGVEAGQRGAFGLVVGVARTGNGNELLENGADIAVGDLAELTVGY